MSDQYGYYGQDGYGLSGEGGQSSGNYLGSSSYRGKEYQDQNYSNRDGESKSRVSRFDPSYQKSMKSPNPEEDYRQPSSSSSQYDYKSQGDHQSNYKSSHRDRDDRNFSGSSRDFHHDKSRYDDQSRPPRYNREDRGYQSGPPRHSDYETQQSSSESDRVVMEDTIFVSNLPKDTNESELAEFFGSIGCIKFDKKTRKPKIYIYRDSDGISKGEATITYDDSQAAPAAINWMNGKDMRGSVLKIEIATRKAPPGGFFARRGGGRGFGSRGRGGFDRSRDDDGSGRNFESNSFESAGVDYRRGGGFSGSRGGRGGFAPGAGDWKCEACGNVNFARRFQCNRCQVAKPSGATSDEPSSGASYSNSKSTGFSADQSYSRQGGEGSYSNQYGNRYRDGGQSSRGSGDDGGYTSGSRDRDRDSSSYGRNDHYGGAKGGYAGGRH